MQKTDLVTFVVMSKQETGFVNDLLRIGIRMLSSLIYFLFRKGYALSSNLVLRISVLQNIFIEMATRRMRER